MTVSPHAYYVKGQIKALVEAGYTHKETARIVSIINGEEIRESQVTAYLYAHRGDHDEGDE